MELRKTADNHPPLGQNATPSNDTVAATRVSNNVNLNHNNINNHNVKITVKEEGKQRFSVRRALPLDNHHIHQYHHLTPRGRSKVSSRVKVSIGDGTTTDGKTTTTTTTTTATTTLINATNNNLNNNTVSSSSTPPTTTGISTRSGRHIEFREKPQTPIDDDQRNGNISLELNSLLVGNLSNVKRGKRSLSSTRVSERSDEKNTKVLRKMCIMGSLAEKSHIPVVGSTRSTSLQVKKDAAAATAAAADVASDSNGKSEMTSLVKLRKR